MKPYIGTISFYRRLLKSMMKIFKGDYEMFHKVRLESRKKILENKDEVDEVKIQKHIFYGEECRDFLQTNLIQGNLQDSGNYRFIARKEHAIGANHIKKENNNN